MLGRPILTRAELSKHRTTVGPISDVIWNPLYDSGNYIGTGMLQLTFFALPTGQGTTTAPGATGTKTLADTNMTAAGQLTKGNEFYMTGQELMLYPGVLPAIAGTTLIGQFVNDTYTLSKSGVLTLTVGSNRTYIQDGPLAVFPPVTRLGVAAAISGATTTNTADMINYGVMAGESYAITPIYLESTQGFQEVITWPALVSLPSAANCRIFNRLRGYLIRDAQ